MKHTGRFLAGELRRGRGLAAGGAEVRPAPTKRQYWSDVPVNYISYYSSEEVLSPLGVIIRHPDHFTYRLHGQPDDGEGELFFELAPSATPEVDWRALPVTDEARQAYRAFISDPHNGELSLSN